MKSRLAAGLAMLSALAICSFAFAQPADAPEADAVADVTPAPAPAAPGADAPSTQPADYPAELDTVAKRFAYTVGTQIGMNLKEAPVSIDAEVLHRGLVDALAGKKPLLTEAQMQETVMQIQKEAMEKMQAQAKVEGEKNQKAATEFLATNKQAEGVKSTETGLQYKVLEEGKGKQPTAADMVKVHYRGALLDGTQFDSSYDRGQPAVFNAGNLIKGWSEGLQLMKEGSKFRFWIPADLAYGEMGYPPRIPPSATLVFDVELLEVNPKVDDSMLPPGHSADDGHNH